MDVGGWLRGLGLGQYEALFRANEIDADIMPELSEADLEKLGVPLGHRKRLLRAISNLAAAEMSAARSASTGPKSHDDAERATRCGLALVDRVAQLGQGEELQARVGIATGLVVVGGEVVEHDVVGETPNLAARLQALAQPGQIVLAGATRRLIGDLFRLTDLGPQMAKGFTQPVEGFAVEGVAVTESRFEGARRG